MLLSHLYPLLRPLIFRLDAECAHGMTLGALDWAHTLRCLPGGPRRVAPVTCMGLDFPNPIGLAAGLDKNGDHLNALGALGFGFIEIGTVTPKPQPGNEKPRLFRIPKDRALINRMGFNNLGLAHCLKQLEKRRYSGILGVNIGKNKVTPIESAVEDYVTCLKGVYPYADYITVNISSPNTADLRSLQAADPLKALLQALKEAQAAAQTQHGRHVPLVVKIAPDLDEASLAEMAEIFLQMEIDGVCATNTTISRAHLHTQTTEAGGLSGAPLTAQAAHILQGLRGLLGDKIPLIGAGGIMDAKCAKARFDAGATLIQLYTGLIYQGPKLLDTIFAESLS